MRPPSPFANSFVDALRGLPRVLARIRASVPIFQIASMARSGETLLLRCLNAHPRLRAVHNLSSVDTCDEAALSGFLKNYRPTSISRQHALVRPYRLGPNQCLVLKQGVWEHRHPFRGVIFARNPLAIFASLKSYDSANGSPANENWRRNEQRLVRWLRDIDPELIPGFTEKTPIDQFATFYNRRMGRLLETTHKIFLYENFVREPRPVLKGIVSEFDLDFCDQMLQSHEAYSPEAIGHGRNRLAQAIHTSSLYKYTRILTKAEFDELSDKVEAVAGQYGYTLRWGTSGAPARCSPESR